MRNSHVGHSGDLAEGSRLGNSFAATTEVSWLLTSEIPDDALDFETGRGKGMSPALRHPNGPAFDTNALQVFSCACL
jgi:hypothetical protein